MGITGIWSIPMAPKKTATKEAAKPAAKPAKVDKKAPASKPAGKDKAVSKDSKKKPEAKKEEKPKYPERKKGESYWSWAQRKHKTNIKEFSNLFAPRPKKYGTGQCRPIKPDLTRHVRWPLYVRRQRKKQLLLRRMKMPPALNQFFHPVSRIMKGTILKMAANYRPETDKERKNRLVADAKARVKDRKAKRTKKAAALSFYLSNVTRKIEKRLASLVLIANDAAPIETVLWMPSLCRKMGVPYAIIKSKSVLGRLVNRKTAAAVAFTTIRSEDKAAFAKLLESLKTHYSEKMDSHRTKWGGLMLGAKHQFKMAAKEAKKKQR
eukprot:NODE_798_length_1174_cov_3686.081778_g567_i0.p2 GENE.NODE_798_length_1174_cov_3686.081778_g567_i0~~NODE_798_length_1174_cov_3686.081778_g567_i0.p2  ORF type:complete len:322 (+),score=118.61 NODE_798_length_1174_cov_3686.081778_g567_i0:83-1048(+)